ncbi:MAG: hypothetical protein Q9170_002662 [Blastenia crenularia]
MPTSRSRVVLERMDFSGRPASPVATQSPLMTVARAFDMIDRLILYEWEGGTLREHRSDEVDSHDQDWLARAIRLQAYEDIDLYFQYSRNGISPAASEATTLTYLADTTCLAAWSRIYLIVGLLQGEYGRDAGIQTRGRTCEILNLALTVSELYDSDEVQHVLFPGHESVAAAIEAKLDNLSLFADVFSALVASGSGRYKRFHPFSRTWDMRKAEIRAGKPARHVGGHQKYPQRDATLVTITVVAMTVSAIPVGLAYHHSNMITPGSTSDADFWLLIQNSLIQLLVLVTTTLTSLGSKRWKPAKTLRWPRLLSWCLPSLGFSCALGAPLLYILVPTMYSAIVSFLGSAMQAGIVLQLALLVDSRRKELKTE